jgi:hypothetical protein
VITRMSRCKRCNKMVKDGIPCPVCAFRAAASLVKTPGELDALRRQVDRELQGKNLTGIKNTKRRL